MADDKPRKPRKPGRPLGGPDGQVTSRERLFKAQALAAEIKNRKMLGELIDKKAEDRKDFARARTVHDAMLNMVPRLTPELMALCHDRTAFEVRFEAGVREGLNSLADLLEKQEEDE